MSLISVYGRVLRNKGYAWFWLGSTVDMLGSEVGTLSVVWFVKELTHSSAAVGAVLSASKLPLAFGSLLAGPLLDRFRRKPLMLLDNLSRGALMLLLPLLFAIGRLQLWHVAAVVAICGALSALTTVGAAAITPALVGETELLTTANALSQVRWQIASLVGPALGGWLLTLLAPPSVLVVDGLTFWLFALAITMLPARVDDLPNRGLSLTGAFREGAALLLGSRPLVAMTLHTFLFNVVYGPLLVALPFYADNALHAGAAGLGLLWTAFAGGSLVGGILGAGASGWPAGRGLAIIALLWGIATFPLAWTTTLGVAVGLMFLAGLCWAPYNVIAVTARQRLVPPEAYGRVFGLTLVITQLGTPLGAWLGGLAVARVGAPATLGLAAAGTLALGAAGLLNRNLQALPSA